MENLKKTQLFDWHNKHGEIVDFEGWAMPIRYSNITEEHLAVRNKSGIFDVSHMGRYWIHGDESFNFLNYLVVRDLSKVKKTASSLHIHIK